MKKIKSLISIILCMVLIAAAALFATGCKKGDTEAPETTVKADTTVADTTVADTTVADTTVPDDTVLETDENGVTDLGEGDTQFTFTVVDGDGNEKVFNIKTDKKTVGEALIDLGLIEGEDGDYGLYVKKVNGILADYEKNKTYWAFYKGGEYSMTGVDKTDVEDGAEYSFKIEK